MRTYTDVFVYDNDGDAFDLHKLETGNWVLKYGTLSVFMSDAQVKELSGAIGRIYWELDIPMELQDPEED